MGKIINIVFMPISIQKGMASSVRLRNLVSVIQSDNIICKNIILYYNELDDTLKGTSTVLIKRRGFLVSFKFLRIINYLLKFKTKDKNILFYYGYPHIKNILYLLLAKLIGYRIIFDIVEDNTKIEHFKSTLAKLRVKSSIYFLKNIQKIANGIIVINDHLYDLVQQNISNNTPIIKIPISIDLNEFRIIQTHDNFNIFYGGSFGEKDGLYYLINAFDKVFDEFPNSKLILSGVGSTRDMNNFEFELSKIKHKDHVIYKGFLSREEYVSLLLNSAVHCMCRTNSPFANAGFPFKLGEMLASGTPVIITKVGNIQKYIIDKENAILIAPENIYELYSALKYVFNNKTEALNIGLQGRMLAEKHFSLKLYKNQIKAYLYSI